MASDGWVEWLPDVTTYVVIGLEVIAFALVPFVLVRRKEPGSTIAWIMTLVFLPVIGAVLFLLFGRSRVRWSAKKKRRADEALQGNLIGFRVAPADVSKLPVSLAGQVGGLFRVGEVLSRSKTTLGNRVDVLEGGAATYAAIGEAIDAAQHHVHVEYYLIRPDRAGRWLFDKLEAAAKRGVQVRLVCDGWGCFALPSSWLKQARRSGVQINYFFPVSSMIRQPISLRNHRKIVVVDGVTSFTGGINIGDEYLGHLESVGAWRDTHVRIYGPASSALQSVFLRDWFFSSKEVVKDEAFFPPVPESMGEALISVLTSGPDTDSEAIHRVFFGAIATARKSVYICTPYFVPDRALVVALQMAALQGVDVRIILPSISNHWVTLYAGRCFYDDLIEAGVHIHEFCPGMIHAKTMVVDGVLSLVGSANMDLRSFRLNFEVHALIGDVHTAQALEKSFAYDLKQTTEITLEQWRKRNMGTRVLEGAARLVSPLL